MLDLEMLSLAIRSATLLMAAASLGVAIVVLQTVKAGIVAMTANAAQRAAEHEQRHAEAMTALRALIARSDAQTHALDAQTRALDILLERTAPTAPAAD